MRAAPHVHAPCGGARCAWLWRCAAVCQLHTRDPGLRGCDALPACVACPAAMLAWRGANPNPIWRFAGESRKTEIDHTSQTVFVTRFARFTVSGRLEWHSQKGGPNGDIWTLVRVRLGGGSLGQGDAE